MKHLRTFEKNGVDEKYWLLPTDDRFEDALHKIGCHVSNFYTTIQTLRRLKNKYVYIGCSIEDGWNYYMYHKTSADYLENNGFKYMGSIDIPDYEMDVDKYNL